MPSTAQITAAPTAAATNSSKGSRRPAASVNVRKAPSAKKPPWAKLTTRITPKISVRPLATMNISIAKATPLTSGSTIALTPSPIVHARDPPGRASSRRQHGSRGRRDGCRLRWPDDDRVGLGPALRRAGVGLEVRERHRDERLVRLLVERDRAHGS